MRLFLRFFLCVRLSKKRYIAAVLLVYNIMRIMLQKIFGGITMREIKEELISDLQRRVDDKILEPTNFELLKKLILKADSIDEAIMISELGTTYKRTGFHFDKRLEKMTDTIKYLKKNKNLSFVTDENKLHHKLIIGDNYPALLNLLIEYKGKIDVIYIDPPYGKDSMGDFAQTNYENAITRDNLLSMLYPRLLLAKRLLSDEGVIFCSIDDKNYAYIKCLFDDILSESNFLATYLWKKTNTPPSLSNKVRKKYEYILCYGNNVSSAHKFSQGIIDGGDAPLLNTDNPLKEIEFPAKSVHFNIDDGLYSASDDKKINLITDVYVKNSLNESSFKAVGNWKWSQKTLLEEIEKGTYFLIKSKKFSVRYQRDNPEAVKVPQNNIDSELNVGTNEDGEKELKSIFSINVFDNPKPISLIEFLINMVNMDNDITILDFFAGSGTTGQAVLELNKEDGGDRKFILCTNNDITETTPDGIAYDVTAKRLKRIMTGSCYDGTNDFEWIKKNTPLGDNLDVYEIAEVADFEATEGKTAFDVIDETLYGVGKFTSVQDKVEWVCNNFEVTQKTLEE